MKVGIYLPQVGAVASPENIKRVATAVEANGYDSLWTFDHVVLRPDQGSDYPYSEDGRFLVPAEAPFLEPLTLMTFAAAVTERVELGTAVLVAPMRAPVPTRLCGHAPASSANGSTAVNPSTISCPRRLPPSARRRSGRSDNAPSTCSSSAASCSTRGASRK